MCVHIWLIWPHVFSQVTAGILITCFTPTWKVTTARFCLAKTAQASCQRLQNLEGVVRLWDHYFRKIDEKKRRRSRGENREKEKKKRIHFQSVFTLRHVVRYTPTNYSSGNCILWCSRLQLFWKSSTLNTYSFNLSKCSTISYTARLFLRRSTVT